GSADVVPILRCFIHGRDTVITLSFAGKLRKTAIEWEEEFGPTSAALEIPALFPKLEVKLDGEIPPRPEGLGRNMLDLTRSYNGAINRSWYKFPTSAEDSFSPLLNKPTFLSSVQFDVRGVIQLKGSSLHLPFPRKREGIRAGQRAQRLHFLL